MGILQRCFGNMTLMSVLMLMCTFNVSVSHVIVKRDRLVTYPKVSALSFNPTTQTIQDGIMMIKFMSVVKSSWFSGHNDTLLVATLGQDTFQMPISQSQKNLDQWAVFAVDQSLLKMDYAFQLTIFRASKTNASILASGFLNLNQLVTANFATNTTKSFVIQSVDGDHPHDNITIQYYLDYVFKKDDTRATNLFFQNVFGAKSLSANVAQGDFQITLQNALKVNSSLTTEALNTLYTTTTAVPVTSIIAYAPLTQYLYTSYNDCPYCETSAKKLLSWYSFNTIAKCAVCGIVSEDKLAEEFNPTVKAANFSSLASIAYGKGYIHVRNRQTQDLEVEQIPKQVQALFRVVYTVLRPLPGSTKPLLHTLKDLTGSEGRKYDLNSSVKDIQPFIKQYNLNTSEILQPVESFTTFNQFFYRKLKPGVRPIASTDNLTGKYLIASPADSRCIIFNTVSDATKLWIKGRKFSIPQLLNSSSLASSFNDGVIAIFRLAPQDYHRFHSPVDGTVTMIQHYDGAYWTVNPLAINSKIDVFGDNARTVIVINTPNLGDVAFVAVGATLVGSILLEIQVGSQVTKGQDIGYFAFGGSTVITLYRPGTVIPDTDLTIPSDGPTHQLYETLVKQGERIGVAA